jgi:ABC-2 type transport system permease protein
MLRYAFRLHRWGLIGYGAVVFLSVVVNAAAYQQLVGTTPAGRATFAASGAALAAQLSYILPPPFRLDTLDGYVQWRAFGALAGVVMIWAIAAAAGAVRGDEERQLVDYWLAARVSRVRLVVTRHAAFGLASVVVAVAAAIAYVLGAAKYETPNFGGVAGKALALWLLMLALFAICYLVAQLVASVRAAQAAGAGVVVVLYLLNVPGRTNHSLDWLAWVSPFRWYDATDSMAPGGHLDVAGVALSVALVVVAGALSGVAFVRRDVRGALFQRPVRAEATARDRRPSPLLSWPVARLLYRQRWIVGAWALVTAVMAVFLVGSAHGIVDSFGNVPGIRDFLTRGAGGDIYRAFVAAYWFGFAQLLLAGFAIHLVSGWASDDTEGILTEILSMPVHRWGVIAERAAVAVIGCAVVVAVGSLVAVATAAAGGTMFDAGTFLRASLLLIPYALTYAAVGAVAASYFPRAAIGVLGVIAFLGYLDYELVPLLKWPTWVADLSVQYLYGTPFLTDVYWTGLWIMIAVVVAGFGAAMLLMQRREVGV